MFKAYITEELHQPERKRVLWEVYCGGARVSALAGAMCVDVEIFSYETGWDFDLQEHQDHFIHRLPGAVLPSLEPDAKSRCKD